MAIPTNPATRHTADTIRFIVYAHKGHASIQLTVDTYGHLVPGGNRAAVDRLDDETQPRRNRMTFQRVWNCRKLLVGRPGIEPGTP